MPSVTELTIDRAKVRMGGVVPRGGWMCPLGHYLVAAGKNPAECTDYNWLRSELGGEDAVVRIFTANDHWPFGARDVIEAMRANEPHVIEAFRQAGVTVTYTGEYK